MRRKRGGKQSQGSKRSSEGSRKQRSAKANGTEQARDQMRGRGSKEAGSKWGTEVAKDQLRDRGRMKTWRRVERGRVGQRWRRIK